MKKLYFLVSVFILPSSLFCQTANEYYAHGIEKHNLQNYMGAISDFTKVLEINPKYKQAYCSRGFAKLSLKDYRGAIVDYTEAIKIDPKDASAYRYRGVAKSVLKDYKKSALEDFTMAIEINSLDADAYYLRGLLKINLGQKDSGCLDLSKSSELGFEVASIAKKKYCE